MTSVLLELSIFGSSDLEREEVTWEGLGDIRPIEKNWDLQPNSSLKELILPILWLSMEGDSPSSTSRGIQIWL